MAKVDRAGGPVMARKVHAFPSHSHVSPNRAAPPVSVVCPPKSTTTFLSESKDMACAVRGAGPVWVTKCHAIPSHSHVSRSAAEPFHPPNKTVTPRAESYAMALPARALGIPVV